LETRRLGAAFFLLMEAGGGALVNGQLTIESANALS
jgi:hypothetical protein